MQCECGTTPVIDQEKYAKIMRLFNKLLQTMDMVQLSDSLLEDAQDVQNFLNNSCPDKQIINHYAVLLTMYYPEQFN